MKRMIAWLLACLIITGMAPAFALTNEEALNKVSSYLTEVYICTKTCKRIVKNDVHILWATVYEGWNCRK